ARRIRHDRGPVFRASRDLVPLERDGEPEDRFLCPARDRHRSRPAVLLLFQPLPGSSGGRRGELRLPKWLEALRPGALTDRPRARPCRTDHGAPYAPHHPVCGPESAGLLSTLLHRRDLEPPARPPPPRPSL